MKLYSAIKIAMAMQCTECHKFACRLSAARAHPAQNIGQAGSCIRMQSFLPDRAIVERTNSQGSRAAPVCDPPYLRFHNQPVTNDKVHIFGMEAAVRHLQSGLPCRRMVRTISRGARAVSRKKRNGTSLTKTPISKANTIANRILLITKFLDILLSIT